MRARKAANPERTQRIQLDSIRRRRYGLGPDEHSLFTSAPACAICKRVVRLVIDHCHNSGRLRGMLCNSCNRMLGLAMDRPDILLEAAAYLAARAETAA